MHGLLCIGVTRPIRTLCLGGVSLFCSLSCNHVSLRNLAHTYLTFPKHQCPLAWAITSVPLMIRAGWVPCISIHNRRDRPISSRAVRCAGVVCGAHVCLFLRTNSELTGLLPLGVCPLARPKNYCISVTAVHHKIRCVPIPR